MKIIVLGAGLVGAHMAIDLAIRGLGFATKVKEYANLTDEEAKAKLVEKQNEAQEMLDQLTAEPE